MKYLIILIILVFVFGIFIILKFKKQKKLDWKSKKEILKFFDNIKKGRSSKEQIIDYDKLYHKILNKLWYSWDFGSILKSNPKIIKDINKIWELHKLRNKLVHDFDLLEEKILKKKSLEYEKIISDLLKKI